ncbi:sulfatase-like hydrolase/transferase [Jannaschia pohangensis]|uniref:Sulfatase n=1 Tax=Jannaschia pohangensis TaxID=390807 RepID=A0A1I3NX70_9RHOB|nr:sulfatase-like hydrolase/transferase [Jannaschia pohangensis]SFJ13893.1 Sulfatase [Jannaschia pohangensis]
MIRPDLRQWARPALAAGVLYLLLALPDKPGGLGDLFAQVPLEWPVLILALVLWPPQWRGRSAIAGILTGVILVLLLLKGADIAMLSSLNRRFSPVVDMFLIEAGLNVLSGSIGMPLTVVAVIASVIAFAAIGLILYRALMCLLRIDLAPHFRPWMGGGLVAALALMTADFGPTLRLWQGAVDPPGAVSNIRTVRAQLERSVTVLRDLRAFRLAAAQDPYADRTGLFDAVDGRDVIVIFIESYGRSSFDNLLYSETHVPTLRNAEVALSDAGYAMQSGWLNSPTAGGQSWLAHGTLASGLRTSDQGRYGAMLASGRQSLFHLAQTSGFRTAAVMPAITLAWPEGLTMGFDTILAAADLNYAGAPFNWITMPDQYTLSAFDALLPPDPRPDFLQIALISSHAPWVPVPEMIDWEDVGDGTAFDRWATSGDPPSVVWRDRDRVRDQYRQAIDYTLQAAMSYAARRADQPLFIILGDHQPAGFVAGIDSRDVAVHLIGPPDLVALASDWNWRDGLVPGADTPVWPMEVFRDRFIRAFTTAAADREAM